MRSSPRVVRDVVICGAGPGGLAAAVYGASEGLDVLVIDKAWPRVVRRPRARKIEVNYLGFPAGVSGSISGSPGDDPGAESFGASISVARRVERLHCDETPMPVVPFRRDQR